MCGEHARFGSGAARPRAKDQGRCRYADRTMRVHLGAVAGARDRWLVGPMRTPLLLTALLGLLLALPAVAAADSIVYLKDGQVWISGADGSGARQFTAAPNSWEWPSESDDGTL